jgi:uncharacterized membrane protein
MSPATSIQATEVKRESASIAALGRVVFALAIIAISIETFVCARVVDHSLGPEYDIIPVIPWVPAISWLAYLFGAIWVACGIGLLTNRTVRPAALALGALMILCALVLEGPKAAVNFGSGNLRTVLFEPLAIGSLAWLLPGEDVIPKWLVRVGRWLLAISLIVFGVDHFMALVFVGTLVPDWIPWHVFWSGFFGVAFIAAGLGIGFNLLQRWAASGLGLMFGIWVITLHLPRVLGIYHIPNASSPNGWSSLFIATAMWGGLWAMARSRSRGQNT